MKLFNETIDVTGRCHEQGDHYNINKKPIFTFASQSMQYLLSSSLSMAVSKTFKKNV